MVQLRAARSHMRSPADPCLRFPYGYAIRRKRNHLAARAGRSHPRPRDQPQRHRDRRLGPLRRGLLEQQLDRNVHPYPAVSHTRRASI